MKAGKPSLELKSAVVVVAAGRGERAGDPQEGPKQYRRIGGCPVLTETLHRLLRHDRLGEIVVVIHPDDESFYRCSIADLEGHARLRTVLGGSTRQISVLRGLEALEAAPPRHVLVHDAVRPFLDAALINRVLIALDEGAVAAVPALAVSDTLKVSDVDGIVVRTVPRSGLYAVQTPQAFAFASIIASHRRAAQETATVFTDDASIAEWDGTAVRLVEGSATNVKLTTKEDIALADQYMRATGFRSFPDVRTGNGYDVHALIPGDGVTLCNTFIPHDRSLTGHSDADVGYHALTDALLATCGAGDIGSHFPPSEPQWKGVDSRIFLDHAVQIVRGKGGLITHADVSLICEAPRIGPHREAMRAAMARDLGIELDRCSVKATTNEKIGFVGRGEGIAAIATATVIYGGPKG